MAFVRIYNKRLIPFINIRGPILTPIAIQPFKITALRALGFEIDEYTRDVVVTDKNGYRTLNLPVEH
jgi:hypothetical protein